MSEAEVGWLRAPSLNKQNDRRDVGVKREAVFTC